VHELCILGSVKDWQCRHVKCLRARCHCWTGRCRYIYTTARPGGVDMTNSGCNKIWREVSTFTARSALPHAVARWALSVSAGFFWALVASRRVCLTSFWVPYFLFLFSLKRGYLKCKSFKISMNFRWCQKCKHKIHTHQCPWQRIVESGHDALRWWYPQTHPTLPLQCSLMTIPRWRCNDDDALRRQRTVMMLHDNDTTTMISWSTDT